MRCLRLLLPSLAVAAPLAACRVERSLAVGGAQRSLPMEAFPEVAAPVEAIRLYRCPRAVQVPPLQGDFDSGPWADAAWTEDFVPIRCTGPASGIRTRAKLLWDEVALYCVIEMVDAAGPEGVEASAVRHNVDMLVARSPDQGGYQIELVAMSSVIDSWFGGRGSRRSRDAYWDAEGLRTAVDRGVTDGTRRWTAGFAMPWSSLNVSEPALEGDAAAVLGRFPQAGAAWRIDLGRSTWRPLLSGWGPMGQSGFERTVWQPPGDPASPESWGIVEFMP